MKILNEFIKIIFVTFISSSAFASNEVFFQCATKDGTVNLELIGKDLKLTMKKNNSIFIERSSKLLEGGYSYNHYSRFNTEYYRITYSSNNMDYAIYKNYEDGQYNSGLQVTDLNVNKEYNYDCNKIHIDKLDELLNILDCDKGSALGCMH
ncbi:TPA: hypothetical protein SMT55_003608 [Proteus mirabilis]|nr:hypothetical protein [Proteus mirabilis]HEK2725900.1 hypothetical protein [Proteus mirabilis]